ncbi:MAG: sigma-70 family RNA polymerase sigma factor [Planctomycetota bacterium]|nr:sigma-70 family RNA polymerase sigma factor [Planctomycetota bacterium]MCX8005484.1 sigma-70 family RNA polymerase sigma factor [Burkholderiaceae bacterium]MDW8372687.1 sigma-70 family RNA polymerase sigma factor [Planctomycetota bacterium]
MTPHRGLVSSQGEPASSKMMSDAVELAQALPAPTAEGVAELLAREEGGLRRVIGFYVRGASAIDDVWQETALRALRRLHTLRDPARLRGWLYQIARHAALDWLRNADRSRVQAHEELPEAVDERGPMDRMLSADRLAAIQRAIAELPPSQREALRLRLEEGLDHAAIAARLGISREAVEVRLYKARVQLRERLAEIWEGEL